ncbi:MAG: biotin/lipoyl-binding protein [Bacteroidetes bacterium]|jgi:pyruvate carboxylase|nr:biotin/lipoyl-binding protein [Bacteroidota bacterium]
MSTQTLEQPVTTVSNKTIESECGKGNIRCKNLVVNGTKYKTRLTTKYEKRKKWELPNRKQVNALIPGTIQKIFVAEGQEVKEGDEMLILEAMKMQNRIMFPYDGKVKKIHVATGDRISKGAMLIEYE